MGNDTNNITAKVDQICDSIRALLLAVATLPEQEVNEEAEDIRRSLEVIRAKEFISVPEAALLLSCSDSHLHNLIQRAVNGTTEHPIPFSDLDGAQRFPLRELLEWGRSAKPKTPKGTKGTKKHKHLSIASRKQG